jgi:hypothetical protein
VVVDIAILGLALASGGGSGARLSLSAEGSPLVPAGLEPAGTAVLYFGVAGSSAGLVEHTQRVAEALWDHKCRPQLLVRPLIRIAPAAVKPVGHSPPPPAELTAGEVVVRVAPRPMEYCALIAGPEGKPNRDQIFGERRR